MQGPKPPQLQESYAASCGSVDVSLAVRTQRHSQLWPPVNGEYGVWGVISSAHEIATDSCGVISIMIFILLL
jgi:hypothetical protein